MPPQDRASSCGVKLTIRRLQLSKGHSLLRTQFLYGSLIILSSVIQLFTRQTSPTEHTCSALEMLTTQLLRRHTGDPPEIKSPCCASDVLAALYCCTTTSYQVARAHCACIGDGGQGTAGSSGEVVVGGGGRAEYRACRAGAGRQLLGHKRRGRGWTHQLAGQHGL